jgi:ABC-type phosphate transport system substrate-binding protein
MKIQEMKILMLAGLLFAGGAALAMAPVVGDVIVIVNKGNENQVDKALVVKIYMGEAKTWGTGGTIAAVDLPEDNQVRANFTSRVLGKSVSNLKSMWADYALSGKAVPPKQLGSDDDVKRMVSGNRNAIGYIKASSLDESVKAVLR